MQPPILEVKDLKAHFHTRRGIYKAVDGMSFQLSRGETLGIVGESGSGKSVSQMSYLGLLPQPPLRIAGGKALFHGMDLLTADNKALRQVRGNRISMIFQEPMTSLNPYLKIGAQLIEPLTHHRKVSKKEAWKSSEEALERVGLVDVQSAMKAFPHEFLATDSSNDPRGLCIFVVSAFFPGQHEIKPGCRSRLSWSVSGESVTRCARYAPRALGRCQRWCEPVLSTAGMSSGNRDMWHRSTQARSTS